MTAENMRRYIGTKVDDEGIVDLSGLSSENVEYIRKKNILLSGQSIRVRGKFGERDSVYSASVVVPGDSVDLCVEKNKNKNVYVVPDFDTDGLQHFCCNTRGVTDIIEFDKTETFVKHNEVFYPHGSSFGVSGATVQVVRESIILVITDDVPGDFPGGDAVASQVLTSGDVVIKDLVMMSSRQVVEKVSGTVTYGINSHYVYDSSTGVAVECARTSHGLSDDGKTGIVKFSVLKTDPDGETDMVDALEIEPSKTSIRSKTESGELTATFDTTGLHFDTDLGDIYFGEDRDFRIHYQPESGLDPSMLQIQSIDVSDGSEYVTRFLITSEPA